jgi:hypothetical protein
MRFPARRSVLMVVTISFVAMVTNVSLQLHLLGHDHQREHDSDKCSVCQHFLSADGKFMLRPESELPVAYPLKSNAEFPLQICVAAFHHNPFSPRAPPLL